MAAKGEDRPKRTNSEVSNDSINDTSIKQQLEAMQQSLKCLTDAMNSILKKEDVESLITNTISSIVSEVEKRYEERMSKLKKEMEHQLNQRVQKQVEEKTKDLAEHIKGLEFENKILEENISTIKAESKQTMANLETQLKINTQKCSDAIKSSNHNEQYSRKNNVKIMDIQEEQQESVSHLTTKVLELLHSKGIQIEKEQILAIHRIPSKKGHIRPVILKMKSNTDKTAIMRKRKEMKAAGHRLVDDVTVLNSALMNRLSLHQAIETTWFFNGSVFALTKNQERIKFDIHDNIDSVINEYRANRQKQK